MAWACLTTLVNDSRSTASTSPMIASSTTVSSGPWLYVRTDRQHRRELIDNGEAAPRTDRDKVFHGARSWTGSAGWSRRAR